MDAVKTRTTDETMLKLDSAAYGTVERLLRTLGAKSIKSNNHIQAIYTFPHGTSMALQNPTRRTSNRLHTWLLRQTLEELVSCGFDARIVLTLLNALGNVSWVKRDPLIEHLTRAYKGNRREFDMTNRAEHERFLRLAVPTFEEKDDEIPEPEPITYHLRDAVMLALSADHPRFTRYYDRVKTRLYNRNGPLFKMLKKELHYREGVKLPELTEAGAMLLAEYIQDEEQKEFPEEHMPNLHREDEPELYEAPPGPVQTMDRTSPPEPSPDVPKAGAGMNSQDQGVAIQAERRVQPGQSEADLPFGKHPPVAYATKLPTSFYAEMSEPQALLRICSRLGILAVFDGYTMDPRKTLQLIARTLDLPHP